MADLSIQCVDVWIEILGVELGHVLANNIRHRIDLAVALANRLHGVRIILHLGFLDTGQRISDRAFVAGDELQHFAIKLILRSRLWISGYGLEKLLQRDAWRAEGIIGLLRTARGKAGGHAVEAAAGITAAERKTGQLNVAGG